MCLHANSTTQHDNLHYYTTKVNVTPTKRKKQEIVLQIEIPSWMHRSVIFATINTLKCHLVYGEPRPLPNLVSQKP